MKKYKRKSELAETIKRNVFFLILTIVFASTMVTMIIVTGKNGEYTRPSGKFATANPEKISFLASLLNQAKQKFAETITGAVDGFSNSGSSYWESYVVNVGWDKVYPNVMKERGDNIRSSSKQYGVNPDVLAAIITKESANNPNAVNVNENGTVDLGLCQINFPGTAQSLMSGVTKEDLFDPELNIHLAAKRLSLAKSAMKSDAGAILAYHYGEAGAKKRISETGKSAEESDDWLLIKAIIRTSKA